MGAPSCTIMATLTPSDGEVMSPSNSRPRMAASRSSTSNATCGTWRTSSWAWQTGVKRIHSMPKGLVSNPRLKIPRCFT